MYYKLCELFGISIKKHLLKTIASVVVGEVTAFLALMVVGTAVLSFFPGLNVGSAILVAVANFGLVYFAGYIFINMMTKIFKEGKDPGDMTESELSNLAKTTSEETDVKKVYEEAKTVRNEAKNDSNYSDYKDVKSFDDEEK